MIEEDGALGTPGYQAALRLIDFRSQSVWLFPEKVFKSDKTDEIGSVMKDSSDLRNSVLCSCHINP